MNSRKSLFTRSILSTVLSYSIISSIHCLSFAAIKQNKIKSNASIAIEKNEGPIAEAPISTNASELLSLPTANREALLDKISDKIYDEIRALAFSTKQSLNTRWKAVIVLGQVKRKNSRNDLLLASDDPAWFVRNAALIAISNYYKEDVLDVGRKLIRDKSLVVRSAAVDALKPLSSWDMVRQTLWNELDQSYNFSNSKKSLWIRAQMVEALALHPFSNEKNKFEKLIHDPDLRVAFTSTFAMEKLTGMIVKTPEAEPMKKIDKWKLALKKTYTDIN